MDPKVSSTTSPTTSQSDEKTITGAKTDVVDSTDIKDTTENPSSTETTLTNNLEALNLNSSPTLSSSSSSHNITSTNSENNANNAAENNADSNGSTSAAGGAPGNTVTGKEQPPTSSATSAKTTYSSNNNVVKYGHKIPNRVFVGGIPDEASDNDVRQLFAQYGSIQSVKIITDRAGISKGYGFVTFDKEEDAQKVIKEADNLIIKNRKLNVSTAVMKHHPPNNNSGDQKMFNNASFFYSNPMIPGANYPFYESLQGYSTMEGLPFIQLGMNHPNCPPLLASSATTATGPPYVGQAYSASYQNPTSYLYPGNASMPMASQQALYQHHPGSQQLLPGTGQIPASHAFQYNTAVSSLAGVGSHNSSVSTGYRYPPSSAAHSSQMNLSAQQQQYIPYQGTVNPTGVNNPPIHLPQTHLSNMAQQAVSEMQNSNAATSPPQKMGSNGGGTNHTAAQVMPHVPNQSIYPSYPSSMASNTNAIQNVHLKNDASNMEVLDGGLISTPSAAGYLPPIAVNDMMWSSHVPINSAYGGHSAAAIQHSLNNMSNNNGKPHHQMMSNSSNNRATSHMNHGLKSSASTTNSSGPPPPVHQANLNNGGTLKSANAYNSNANQYSSSSNRDKVSNARHNPSSYTASHKKMYNGNNGNNNYYNSQQNKPRVMNGGTGYVQSLRHPPPPTIDPHESLRSNQYHHQSNMASSSHHSHSQQHHLRHPAPVVAAYPNPRQSLPLITKTINGVQIYALPDNNNGPIAAAINGSEAGCGHHPISNNNNNTPPTSPMAPYGTSSIPYKT